MVYKVYIALTAFRAGNFINHGIPALLNSPRYSPMVLAAVLCDRDLQTLAWGMGNVRGLHEVTIESVSRFHLLILNDLHFPCIICLPACLSPFSGCPFGCEEVVFKRLIKDNIT